MFNSQISTQETDKTESLLTNLFKIFLWSVFIKAGNVMRPPIYLKKNQSNVSSNHIWSVSESLVSFGGSDWKEISK